MLWSHRLTETRDDTHTHTHTHMQWSGLHTVTFPLQHVLIDMCRGTVAAVKRFQADWWRPSLCWKLTRRTGRWHTRSSAEAAGRLAASLPARHDRACFWQLGRQPVTSAGSWSALRDGARSVRIMSSGSLSRSAWGGEGGHAAARSVMETRADPGSDCVFEVQQWWRVWTESSLIDQCDWLSAQWSCEMILFVVAVVRSLFLIHVSDQGDYKITFDQLINLIFHISAL